MDREIRKAMKNQFDEFPYKMISGENIERMGIKWFSRDQMPKHLNNGCYIMNLDDHTGPGTHWVTIIISKPYLYYINSFGTDDLAGYPPEEVIKHAKKNNLRLIISKYWHQHLKSWLCGFYSLYYCKMFEPYIDNLKPKKFNELLYQAFDDKPDVGDIRKIMKWSIKNDLI